MTKFRYRRFLNLGRTPRGSLFTLFGLSRASVKAQDPAPCELGDLLIDDFTTGKYQKSVRPGDTKLKVQRGSMVGGARRTNFIVPAHSPPSRFNQYGLPAELIIDDGALIVSNGIWGAHRLEVAYGSEADLNLDLSGCDRFQVNYDANDLVVNFNIVLFSTNRGKRTQFSINQGALINPTSVEFLFSDSKPVGGFDFAVDDVDIIVIIFQTGSAVGANDYAITSVLASGGS